MSLGAVAQQHGDLGRLGSGFDQTGGLRQAVSQCWRGRRLDRGVERVLAAQGGRDRDGLSERGVNAERVSVGYPGLARAASASARLSRAYRTATGAMRMAAPLPAEPLPLNAERAASRGWTPERTSRST
jgi:hypothetical protein